MTKPARRKLEQGSKPWLERASRWRLLSLMFQLPTRESRRELRRLAGSAPRDLSVLASAWAGAPMQLAAAEFHRVLGPGGIPAVESSYDPNALAGRGPLLADIAGFHEAFAYRPEKPPAEVPDHIAVELDFLSYMGFKVAFALHEGRQAEAQIAAQAYERFLEQHLSVWIGGFRERLARSASSFFLRAAEFVEAPVVKARKPVRPSLASPVLAVLLLFFSLLPAAAQSQPPVSGSAPAQEKTETKKAAAPLATGPKAITLGSITLSGSLRGRMENWGWFETPSGENSYTFGALALRLALGQRKERFDWQVEGIVPFLIRLPADAVLAAPQGQLGLGASYFAASGRQDGSASIRQAFVRFKNLVGHEASSLRLGRFEFSEGAEIAPADATLAVLKRDRIAQRLVGPFGFTHIGRGFDGVHYVCSSKQNNFTLLAARPTEGVFQLRSLKEVDVDFVYGAFTRQIPGPSNRGEWRAFLLHYHDGRGTLKTDNRPAAARAADTRNIRMSTIGGHAIAAFDRGPGTIDLLFWGAAQFGRWGTLDHRAGAFAAEAGYQFKVHGKPWLRAGFFRSSGDNNPADGAHRTFFQILSTPRMYARFPFYNLMNNQDVFGEFRWKPASRFTLRADVRHLRLSSRQDLWYTGGGAFENRTFGYAGRPSNGRSTLGTLVDLSVDVEVTAKSILSLYAGGVRGGAVPAAIYPAGGSNPGGRFFYLEFLRAAVDATLLSDAT